MKSWGEHEGLLVEFIALAADSNGYGLLKQPVAHNSEAFDLQLCKYIPETNETPPRVIDQTQ